MIRLVQAHGCMQSAAVAQLCRATSEASKPHTSLFLRALGPKLGKAHLGQQTTASLFLMFLLLLKGSS